MEYKVLDLKKGGRMKPRKRRRIIERKIEELKGKYEETKSLNESAWRSHGSELCSVEMTRNEERILEEIRNFEDLLAMPEMDMPDKVLKQKISETTKEISAAEEKKEELSKQQGELRAYLILIKSIREMK